MKSKKRLTLIVLTIMAMIACLIGAVACGGGKDADVIDMYILPQNETLVDSDFSLPKTIGADGAVAVTWTSSNTNAIAIEDGGEEYTAKVTLQAEVTPVTLTIAAGKAKKDFTVRVDALNVFTFINHFTFAQEKTSVTKDFDLLTSTSFAGQSATIAWSVSDDASKSYIEVQNGNKVHIKPDYDLVDVKIDAKFTYNGDSVTQSYTFSVSPEFDPLQKVNRMYSQADYPLEISGYIVHAYEVSESYGNATMYIVSDDYTYGYYLYRAKFTGDASQYVKGAHVTYSGGTAKNYNGLWENNSNGTVSADGKPAGDIDGHVYAMDTDLLANVPSLLWRESTLVSLSGWKVTKGEKPTGADADLFTLEKNSKKITVRISKYVNRTDDELTALCNVYDSLKDGDFVDVKGILGCYKNNFQIQPILASDIKKVDAAVENKDGDKLAAAVKAVNDAVKANIGSLVAADKNFTMPTDKDGVTISYKLTPSSLPASTFTVSINGGDFSVKPTTSEKNYDIQVTYTLGGKNYYSFFKLRNWKLTAQQIVDTVESYAKKERIANITASGDVTLPDIDALGTTLTWSVKGEMPTWLKISGNKATVSQLPEFESELIFVVTISLDGATSKSYEYKAVKVSARPNVTFEKLTEAKEGTYKFAMLANGTMLYATGKMDGYYYGTTNDSSKAADFVIKKVGDNQYTVTIEGKYLEIIPRTDGSKGVNIAMNDKQTAGKYWQWNDGIKNFVMESTYNNNNDPESTDVDLYYFGTSGTYTTMSGNYISRIATKNDDGTYTANGKEDVEQWVAHFGEVKKGADKTDQDKVDAAIADVNAAYTVEVAGDWLLPTCKVNGVTFTWAIKGTSTYRLTTEKTKLIVNELPASDATVKLTLTATLDGKDTVTASKDVTVTIKAALVEGQGFQPITAPAAGSNYYLAMDVNGEWYYSTGAKDGNFLGTTTEIANAAKVTVAASGDGWTLVTNGKYIEFESSTSGNKTYVNIMLKDTQTAGKVWTWNAQYAVFTMDEGGTTYFMGTYGTYRTFNSAKLSFIEGDDEYVGKIGTYNGEIPPAGGGTTPGGTTPGTESHATLTFDNTDKRTTGTTSEQVWTENGVTLTNKGQVNTQYYNPVRLYKNTTVKIEYGTAITKIVFHSSENYTDDSGKSTPYCDYLKQSLEAVTDVTVTADGTTITVVLATPAKAFEFTASVGQCRLLSLEVYTDGSSGSTDPAEGGGTSGGDEPGTTVEFTRLEEPTAGDFIYSVMYKGTRLYASSLELSSNYIATTSDASQAVKFTLETKNDHWYIKMGQKYLEVSPYDNSKSSQVSYSLRLVDTPTEGAYWEWDSEIKIFKQKPVAIGTLQYELSTAYFYIGMRDNATFNTMSPSDIKYITGDNAANLDVSQHPARFGTVSTSSAAAAATAMLPGKQTNA